MIYTNVKTISLSKIKAKKLVFSDMLKMIKASKEIYIDTETCGKNFNYQEHVDSYVHLQIQNGKKITATTKKSAEKYAQEIQKELALDPHRSDVRLFQIATDKDDIFVIDTFVATKKEINSLIKTISDKPMCGQNIKFDLKVIKANYKEFTWTELFDTMIAFRMIRAYQTTEYVKAHLANVVQFHLGIELLKGHGADDWSQPITDEQFIYSVEDVKYLKQTALKQINELNNNSVRQVIKGYFNNQLFDVVSIIEMKFISVLITTELKGVPLNIKGLKERAIIVEKELTQVSKIFKDNDVNTSSPKQLMDFIDKMCPDINIMSTSKEALERHRKNKLIEDLLLVKKLQKEFQMITDYITIWHRDGIIYPNFQQIRAPTGRMSCYDPNLQQIPRHLKNLFYLASSDNPIFRIDYPSIEARTGGVIMQDQEIIRIFKEGKDMHIETAAAFLHKKPDEVTSEERRKAKAANFGFLFGMGAKTYVDYAYQSYGLNLTFEESVNTRNLYLKRYKGVAAFHNKTSLLLRDNREYIGRTILGRKMMIDQFTNGNNYPVQGSAIDILKLAAGLFYYSCKEKQIDATIINIVHDELVVITTKKDKQIAQAQLKDSMERAANFAMPQFKTECEVQEL